MPDYGLSSTGYTAPTSIDVLAVMLSQLEADLSAELGVAVTIDPAVDVVFGRVLTVASERIGALSDATQALYDSFDVATATGSALDALALLVGVTRDPATHGTVTLTLTGVTGTVIPDGSYVAGGGPAGVTRWITSASVTLAGGTGSVVAECEDAGLVTADAGEIDAIATPVSGWTGVTNAAAVSAGTTAGTARETDAALRRRRLQSLQLGGSRSANAIRAQLLALDYVDAAVVVGNPTNAVATVEGVSVDPWSTAIVVDPDGLTDAQETEIATTIYAYHGAPTKLCGDVEHTITDTAGYAQVVRWSYATEQAVVVAVVVTRFRTGYVLADVEQPALDALADLFLTLAPGDALDPIAVAGTLWLVPGIGNATVTLDGAGVSIDPDATVRLTLDPSSSVTE